MSLLKQNTAKLNNTFQDQASTTVGALNLGAAIHRHRWVKTTFYLHFILESIWKWKNKVLDSHICPSHPRYSFKKESWGSICLSRGNVSVMLRHPICHSVFLYHLIWEIIPFLTSISPHLFLRGQKSKRGCIPLDISLQFTS